jgi:outer membrane protein assembly factor BamB
MRRLRACALVLAGALTHGCKSVPLTSDPLSPRRTAPPQSVFSVDWWEKLVFDHKLLDYAPREPAQPAYDAEGRQVVVLTRDGVVTALGRDGARRWKFETASPFSAGATVSEGRVYVPGGDGTLYALDSATGKKLWEYRTGEELGTEPVLADGVVLVASHNDALYAVEAASGKWLWQYRRESPAGFTIRGVGAPTVRDGVVYVGFADGVLTALDLKDGAARWERQLSPPTGQFIDVDTTPVFDEAGRLLAASYKGGLFALDPQTGRPVWNTPVNGVTHLLSRGEVIFATGDGRVSAFLAQTGRQLWSLPLENEAGRRPVVADGLLVVPLASSLLFVDPTLGQAVLRWDPGQGVSAPAMPAGDRLFVLSNLGFLYALAMDGGQG